MCKFSSKSGWVAFQISFFLGDLTRNDPVLLYYMCAKRIKFLMTRLSVCGLEVSCNEMSDTPMLLVVRLSIVNNVHTFLKIILLSLLMLVL